MDELLAKAANIKLLILDVDGVLSDGKLYFSNSGDEMKAFSTLDGQGIKMLQRNGIEVGIITGRTSALVQRRADNLGIKHLVQGREDKLVALKEMSAMLNIDSEHIAYMGDDLPDLAAIRHAHLGITVADGHAFVAEHADWITSARGGNGAVREACEFLLKAQGKLSQAWQHYL
ncbi:MAG: 3-deoxy-D-manno-octulosonate 8-phosphate phosphatase (KDO 8-P phosphatase) [Paraglaciecola psychrophila]|jgi:3-deoxy-D-manno-octulosonate 8-phosphate phosphatase (KDO 8-P phosphatase)